MYKFLVAATLLVSAVNASNHEESYGEASYEAPSSYDASYKPAENKEYGNYEPEQSYEPEQKYEPEKVEEKPKIGGKPCATGKDGIHDVLVGGEAGLIYTPSSVLAKVGDTVRFHFLMKNHTVTQSTFDKPCVKKPDGVDSNFRPNQRTSKDIEEKGGDSDSNLIWEYKVDTEEPTWWYCRQRTGTHCGKGMVFAINPNAEKTFQKFQEFAQQQNGTADGAPPPAYGNEGKDGKDAPPPQYAPPAMAPGYNAGSADKCSCQCLCSVSSFKEGSGLGVGMTGGMPGSAPAPWANGGSY